MRDTSFAREFRKLIVQRVEELVAQSQEISESVNTREYKLEKLDEKLDMINHNFKCYSMFFKTPHGQRENILANLEILYRLH